MRITRKDTPGKQGDFRFDHLRGLAAVAALCALAGTAAAAAAPQQGDHARGRILVMPRAGLPAHELGRIVGVHGGKARKVGQSELHVVELPPGLSEQAVVERLARHPHLKFAELDRRVAADLVTNDPYNGSAWHLGRIGAPTAWDASRGSGVTIAVLDSGVDPAHPDLAPALVPGWNFHDNNSDTRDVNGHGTKVAGAAAAVSNNAIGVAGVAGAARIMPIRVADSAGYTYWSTLAKGITYAADRGVRVANASFAAYGSASVQSAAQYMKNKNGLVFVSAGNTGAVDNAAPSASLVAVSATGSGDVRASWSSWGPYVALSAPGASIYTTVRGGGYGTANGTSFASPISAAAAALLMSARPTLTSAQVEGLLFSTAVDLGAAGRDPYYGHGRLNAAAAMAAALAAVPAPDATAPTAAITAPLAASSVGGLVNVNATASDNSGVARVELRVNGSTVAIDSAAPFAFTWDSRATPNGMATLEAVAFDTAGNSAASAPVGVNVANAATTTASVTAAAQDGTLPAVSIVSPVPGAVAGTVIVTTNASDDQGAAGITQSLYIDGVLRASGTGATLSYSWNTRKAAAGVHTIEVRAQDAAGNGSTSAVQVTR